MSVKVPRIRPKTTAHATHAAPQITLEFGPVMKRFTHGVSRCSWLMADFWKM